MSRNRLWVVVAATVLVMATAQQVAHRSDGIWNDLAVPLGAAVVTSLALALGLTWRDLGLSSDTWRRGAKYAGIAAGIVVAVVAVGALIPGTREAFQDDRYSYGVGKALLVALVGLPLRTVIPEELVFRGILLAAFTRLGGVRAGVIGSSVLFGLWHVLSSLHLSDDNAAASVLGSGTVGQVLSVAGAVLFTTGAGVLLCWLRLRSRSLLAPIGLHWAINGAGIIASAIVWTVTN